MNSNSYKAIGLLYKIEEISYTKNGFPKLFFYVEVPTFSIRQKTEIFKFTLIGDEAKNFELHFEEGNWVEIMFAVEGRFWTPPDEPDKQIHIGGLRPVDVHKTKNPFEEKPVKEIPQEELSSQVMNDLTKNVKNWKGPSVDELPFEQKEEDDDLPF